uniref:Uncharacterized protein n=1 Tax=Lepeophtheirus salmonis TaxID=72036 RepID=A0A0K2VJV1_LEPSM
MIKSSDKRRELRKYKLQENQLHNRYLKLSAVSYVLPNLLK